MIWISFGSKASSRGLQDSARSGMPFRIWMAHQGRISIFEASHKITEVGGLGVRGKKVRLFSFSGGVGCPVKREPISKS
jgi:hypothetical protein